MNRPASLSLIAMSLLLATATVATAQQRSPQQSSAPQSGQVTMGGNLLTPEEEQKFKDQRRQAKTRADRNRVEAQQSALLNQRVAERVNAAQQTPSTAERPPSSRQGTMPPASGGTGGR